MRSILEGVKFIGREREKKSWKKELAKEIKQL